MSDKEAGISKNMRTIIELIAGYELGFIDISVRDRLSFFFDYVEKNEINLDLLFDIIMDTADDFIGEGQKLPENRTRLEEVKKAANNLERVFDVIRRAGNDNPELNAALGHAMWSPFVIALACDRENLDRSEVLNIHNSLRTQKARSARLPGFPEWAEQVYQAVCKAIPTAQASNKAFRVAQSTDRANYLKPHVERELKEAGYTNEVLKEKRLKLTTNIIVTSIDRYLKEKS